MSLNNGKIKLSMALPSLLYDLCRDGGNHWLPCINKTAVPQLAEAPILVNMLVSVPLQWYVITACNRPYTQEDLLHYQCPMGKIEPTQMIAD